MKKVDPNMPPVFSTGKDTTPCYRFAMTPLFLRPLLPPNNLKSYSWPCFLFSPMRFCAFSIDESARCRFSFVPMLFFLIVPPTWQINDLVVSSFSRRRRQDWLLFMITIVPNLRLPWDFDERIFHECCLQLFSPNIYELLKSTSSGPLQMIDVSTAMSSSSIFETTLNGWHR